MKPPSDELNHQPGPAPEEVIFIRSDQYFLREARIPAVLPVPDSSLTNQRSIPRLSQELGTNAISPAAGHMEQPGLDFMAAASYARFVFLCGGQSQKRGATYLNSGDFFGEHYAKNSRNLSLRLDESGWRAFNGIRVWSAVRVRTGLPFFSIA